MTNGEVRLRKPHVVRNFTRLLLSRRIMAVGRLLTLIYFLRRPINSDATLTELVLFLDDVAAITIRGTVKNLSL